MTDSAEIFISYTREDAGFVANLVKELERSGYSVWWDTRISAGSEFDSVIEAALDGASCVLVVWSEKSVKSEWVKNEASEGLRRNILIPIRIDDVDLPLAFRRRQTIDMFGSESYDRVTDEVRSVIASTPGDTEARPVPRTRRRRLIRYGPMVHVVYIALIAIILAAGFRLWPNTSPGMQLPLSLKHFSYQPTQFRKLALSPDGRKIAYVGVDAGETFLYVKDLVANGVNKLPETDGASAPFFSPDGNWIGFFARGKLNRSPVAGGNPVEIASIPKMRFGASWGDDGSIVFSPETRSPIMRIAANGGEISVVTRLEDGEFAQHKNPFALPGSQAILYQRGSVGGGEIWVEDLASDESRFVIQGVWPQYHSGKLLFYRGTLNAGSIWAVSFDLDRLSLSGDPEPIVEATHSPFAASANGTLVYSVPSLKRSRLLLLDRSGGETPLKIHGESTAHMRFSPDGQSLAIPRTFNGQTDIWIYDLKTDDARQWSFDGGRHPIWSPDGSRIAYTEYGAGIVARGLEASDPPSTLIDLVRNFTLLQWNAQGILYSDINRTTSSDLYFRANNGDQRVIQDDEAATSSAHISPDGAWIAIAREEAGAMNVYVEPFPDGGSRRRVDVANGDWPTWSADGAALYLTSLDRLVRVRVTATANTIVFGEPTVIRELSSPSQLFVDWYDVLPDESQIVLTDVEYLDPPVQVLVTNWPELLLD